MIAGTGSRVRGLHTADEARLRAVVRGTVVTPAGADYDDARRVFNGAVAHRPLAVAHVVGADDIAAALRFSRERGLSISVRGGGHGVAGRAVAGDVVLDLRALCGVRVDARRRIAVVGGGATCAAVDAATTPYGLAVPASRVGGTGVAGLAMGGGIGWLTAAHGLTSDNLLAAQLVTADGLAVSASQETEPALFWALQGGGAPGAVTSLSFRLHQLPAQVLGGMLLYPLSELADVLGSLRELRAREPSTFAGVAVLHAAPPQAFVPGDVVGRPVVSVVPAWLGDPREGQAFVGPLRRLLRPLADTVAPMSYPTLQSLLGDLARPGLRQRWSATLLSRLTDPVVADLEGAGAAVAGTGRHVLIAPVPDTSSNSGAVPSHKPSWLVQSVAQWRDPAGDSTAAQWVTDLCALLRRRGELGSWPALDANPQRVRAAFGRSRIARLQAVTAAWDPDGVFAHSNPITPADPRA